MQTALFAGASELRGLSASLEKPAFTYVSFLMKHDDTCLFFLIYIYIVPSHFFDLLASEKNACTWEREERGIFTFLGLVGSPCYRSATLASRKSIQVGNMHFGTAVVWIYS